MVLSSVNSGRTRPSASVGGALLRLRARLAAAPRLVSWLLTVLVAFFGGLLRFIRLGEPRAVVFDETYYVKDAWTMLLTGEPRNWPEFLTRRGLDFPVDTLFAQGDTNRWLSNTEYVVHPPVGKWCIALGLKLFGGAGNTFAWRASTAIAGTIAIIIMIRVALRLFNNMSIALSAGLLMSVDGVGITLSRTGLLDIFIMVFVLGAFDLLLMHRDWARVKLRAHYAVDAARRDAHWIPDTSRRARRAQRKAADGDSSVAGGGANDTTGTAGAAVSSSANTAGRNQSMLLDARGPVIAFSWYRAAAAILIGLATGVKWSGIYFMAAFCVISVIWDAWERYRAGYRSWLSTGLLCDAPLTALYMLPLWAGTYLAGWIGWFIHPDSYMHDWARNNPGQGITWLPEGLRSFVEYHVEMWQFHTTLDTPHDYKANPLTWPLQVRPTSFYWQELDGHPGLCSLAPHSKCVAAVTSLGNPLIWWLGSLCVIIGIIIAIVKHGDWRIWAVLAGFIGGWLPWAQYLHRTTFTFYSIVILPWIILAICYVGDHVRRRVSAGTWRITLTATLLPILLVSVFFYPIWTAMPVPYEFWLSHMWFKSWI
ncbi:glycosyl transferase family 39 [Bifidobacterium thermophilum RBL67]|uniref:Polyprenol-phosphate-mannose--protein mannosyltransferase n=1 Tax=Bifidobacterium thermophilum RBL67 TaxID=1254439 RepID=M4RID4_9BIFI|nr:glycosyl transferase family 39 [Bifidobacterium thermophilum RBL67]